LTGLHDLCTLGQLILQSATGVLVLVLCFVERKEFSTQIVSKLGSSFSIVPFIIVVVYSVILLPSNSGYFKCFYSIFLELLLKLLMFVHAGILYHPSYDCFTANCSTSLFPHPSHPEGKSWHHSDLCNRCYTSNSILSLCYWQLSYIWDSQSTTLIFLWKM
jgi:hypothetical protein